MKTTISEGSKRDSTGDEGRSMLPNNSSDGLAGGSRSFSGGPVGTGKPMCYSCEACDNHAKGYPVGHANKGGYLIYGISKVDY